MRNWLVTGMAVLLLGGVTGITYATSAKANPTLAQSVSPKQHSISMSNAEHKDLEVSDDQKQEENQQEIPDSVEQSNLQKQVTITETVAQKRALEHQVGTVIGVQLEDEDGQAVYNVQITDSNGQSWEVKIDGNNGSFIKSEQGDSETGGEDSDQETNGDGNGSNLVEHEDSQKQEGNQQEVPDSIEQTNLQKQVTITEADAQKRALEHQTGTVAGIQLEDEDGQAVYNVQIKDSNGQSWEVKVDGKTGSFIKSEQGDSDTGGKDSD